MCLILAQLNIGVMRSVESRLRILEILFDKVLKDDVDSLNARLDNLEKREKQNEYDIDRTVLKEELREIVDDVNAKTKRILSGFSAEKENLRNVKKSIVNKVKGIEQHFVDIDKQVDGLDKRVQGIDKHCNDTSDHMRLIDSRVEVIDKHVNHVKKQGEQTANQVDNIDLQVVHIDFEIGSINKNLTEIDKQVKNIDNQIKDNAEKIQDIDNDIAVVKIDVGNLKEDIKAAEKNNCPHTWFKRQLNSCIWYVRDKREWVDAQIYCQIWGSNLVEPISQDAFEVLTRKIPSRGEKWWIGASDRSSEGKWKWQSSGNRVTDVNWKLGEPNDADEGEDCMELFDNKYLNDVPCDRQEYFICETKL